MIHLDGTPVELDQVVVDQLGGRRARSTRATAAASSAKSAADAHLPRAAATGQPRLVPGVPRRRPGPLPPARTSRRAAARRPFANAKKREPASFRLGSAFPPAPASQTAPAYPTDRAAVPTREAGATALQGRGGAGGRLRTPAAAGKSTVAASRSTPAGAGGPWTPPRSLWQRLRTGRRCAVEEFGRSGAG